MTPTNHPDNHFCRKYQVDVTVAERNKLLSWQRRVGVETPVKAIKLLMRIGLNVTDFPPFGSLDENGEPFYMRMPPEMHTALFEASRLSGRSLRAELLCRLEQSFNLEPQTQKGGAPALETRSASSKSQPER